MKKLTLTIPDDLDEKEVTMMLASKLYEDGKLTSGQAAALVNITKREFLEALGKYGVSIFNAPIEDIEQDMKNAGKF